MEASFFVTDDALRRITPNMQQFDETGILSAFDLNRNLIHAIAAFRQGKCRTTKLSQKLRLAAGCGAGCGCSCGCACGGYVQPQPPQSPHATQPTASKEEVSARTK
jgi:hypothetical protein